MKDEESKDILEKELLKRVQQNKGVYVYQDLLVWLYMQRNDFDGAILQSKSLDILRNEDGTNVMRIANTAAEQQDYTAAIKGYQFVVGKGSSYPYFISANLELINVQRDKLIHSPAYTMEQLLALKSTYRQFIQLYQASDIAINATIELAQLEALYVHETDTAIQLLLPLVDNNRLNKEFSARAKLNLGDYYIMQDNPWDAQLLYTQVEKDFKGTPTGEDAKFRNARLSYYKGDFEWAQTQLKIIKANTSELISNDAIDLSVFVLDNLNTDTTDYALLKFAKADLLRFQNKLDEAEDTLNDILKNYNGSSLMDDVNYMKYKIERQRHNYAKAAEYLLAIEKYYGEDILGDNAVFFLGELYQRYLNDEEQAKAYYEKIITTYKDSTFSIEARKRYRKLRGDS
jgi:TolA-binding protein